MRGSLKDRLMDKVSPEPNSGCWLWTGCTNDDGYGVMSNGKAVKAHRIAYELFCGPIPESKVVRHLCDVRCCVNPTHLKLGTQMENVADRGGRNRTARGKNIATAKLTEDQVREIRAGIGSTVWARKFGVNRGTIAKVRTGRSWSHVSCQK